jgi:ABC-type sugar transport system ATPase subunit
VAESRSILDNVWLGHDGLFRARHANGARRRLAGEAFERLLGRSPDLGEAAGSLSLSDRQALSIARALLGRPRILILDEATSSLDLNSRGRLAQIIQGLVAEGTGVVFITHRVDEMSEIGDRVTVMRSGQTVSTLRRGAWTVEELVPLMSGTAEPGERTSPGRDPAAPMSDGTVVMEVRDLVLRPGRQPVNLDVFAGELLGVAGLEGHGQGEFLDAIRGAGVAPGRVTRVGSVGATTIRSVSQAAAGRIAYVPRERSRSLFPWMSIRENFGMPTLSDDARGGWLDPSRTRRRFGSFVERLGIWLRDSGDRITTLSGGNQQKVILARWLASRPDVLVLNDPTRGIDIRTKRDLYGALAQLAAEGMAIVMSSSDLDEHVDLMHRVLVFREHEIVATYDHSRLTREALVASFFAQKETGDVG